LIATDASGDIFIVANVAESSGRPQIRAIKTDPLGNPLASFDFGGSSETFPDLPSGAAVDPQGNLVIVGTTASTDFPLVSPVFPATSTQAGFVVKLDAQLSKILFSTRLGGSQAASLGPGSTSANAVALDTSGNIYVTGATAATDFPTTSGAFQTTGPAPTGFGFGSPTFGFVTEIASNGRSVVYSTYYGSNTTNCSGGSSCLSAVGTTTANAIAIDGTGAVVIGGNTTANSLSITPGVLGQQCGCMVSANGVYHQSGFLAKFAAGGRSLVWATYVPLAQMGPQSVSTLSITSVALAPDGSVIAAGNAPVGLFVTTGSLQPSYPGTPFGQYNAGFIARINALATGYVFSTYFGDGVYQSPTGAVAIDSQGNIWLTGGSDPNTLPFLPSTPQLGSAFIAELSADGSSVLSGITAPAGAAGQGIRLLPNGSPAALGTTGSVLLNAPGQPASLMGIANSAGVQASNNVAPYELVSLYGIGLGPTTPLSGIIQNGAFTTSLGGVQVLFNNVAAPLLYAGSNQINAVVPSSVAAQDVVHIQIRTPTGLLDGPLLGVAPSQPEVFQSGPPVPPGGVAAALNHDGSVNSAGNPAASGSVVTIWATGAGLNNGPGNQDGLIASILYAPLLPVSVLTDLDSLEVLYAGNAPGLVTGVIQINFRLPSRSGLPNLSQVPFQLQIGGAISSRFSLFVTR